MANEKEETKKEPGPVGATGVEQEAKEDFTLVKEDINIEDLMAELRADDTFVTLIKKSKENPEKPIKAILMSLLGGAFVTKACSEAKIARMTFWRWEGLCPKLKEIADRCKGSRIENVEDALYNSAMAGNVTAQIFYLTNRNPEDWKRDAQAIFNNRVINTNITTKPRDPKEMEIRDKVRAWTQEQRDKFLKIVQKVEAEMGGFDSL